MPTSSSNTRYSMPFNYGDSGWDDELNAILDSLEVDVEFRDTDANKSAYVAEAEQGAKFFARDTGDVYWMNGGVWEHIASTGLTPSFTKVVTQKLDGDLTNNTELLSLLGDNLSVVNGQLTAPDDTQLTEQQVIDVVTANIDVSQLNSGGASATEVPKADGSGGVYWGADEGNEFTDMVIAAGETVTIPTGFGHHVPGDLTVNGSIEVNGFLQVK